MKKYYLIFILSLFLVGCAALNSATIGTPDAVLLPENRIFQVKAGTEINNLILDKKPLGKMIFPNDMFLVSSSFLTKKELDLNNAILDKTKSDKKNGQIITILTLLFGGLVSGLGIWFKLIPWVKGISIGPKK